MGQLWRNLENQLAPGIGNKSKVVVLENVIIFTFLDRNIHYLYMSLKKLSYIFQATNEIKYLEDQAKELQENYEALKLERELLLAEKEKTFHGNFCSSIINSFVIDFIWSLN